MYPIKNYICLVDSFRRPSRRRNTAGRYRVGAKSADEAKKLLQKAVGFGSVQVLKEDDDPRTASAAKYKECFREIPAKDAWTLAPVRRATDPIPRD